MNKSNKTKTVAIGDIHGESKLLMGLVRQLAVEEFDTVVFLGDYIDRGPDSRGVIDTILRLQKDSEAKVVCLLGNHEDWMIKTMNDFTSHSWLLSMSAWATISSYSVEAAAAIRREVKRLGVRLFTEKVKLPYQLLFDTMPESHKQFFRELELCHEDERGFYSHAGINVNQALDQQERPTLVWGDVPKFHGYRGKPVVYGHWGNAEVSDTGEAQPFRMGDTFGIDSIKRGVLTALELPSQRLIHNSVSGDI